MLIWYSINIYIYIIIAEKSCAALYFCESCVFVFQDSLKNMNLKIATFNLKGDLYNIINVFTDTFDQLHFIVSLLNKKLNINILKK